MDNILKTQNAVIIVNIFPSINIIRLSGIMISRFDKRLFFNYVNDLDSKISILCRRKLKLALWISK